MKLHTTTLTAIIAIILHFFTIPAGALTFEEMEQGAAVIATVQPETQLTPAQIKSATALSNYSKGFFSIAFNAILLSPNNKNEAIYKPSEWMSDPKRCATSLLDFITRHKPSKLEPDHDKTHELVFLAWYLHNCENSDTAAKMTVVFLLNKAFGPGFPGADDLVNLLEVDPRQGQGRAIPLDEKK